MDARTRSRSICHKHHPFDNWLAVSRFGQVENLLKSAGMGIINSSSHNEHKQRVVKKGSNAMSMTFEQVVELIRQLPDEQQEMLIDLIHSWRTEARRREIARDAQESLAAFHSGQLQPQSAQAVIAELRRSLAGPE